ncbi:hypothetical protein N7470_003953 [Penicillium chermesinum]|nr:hypothetical protein N7470_003953 [Penicillium chermesinum]
MATSKSPEGAEDVNDFLLRIRELGERRDKEDDQRTKKLEDEILQGRKERAGPSSRYLPAPHSIVPERARSIAGSPTMNPLRMSTSSIGQSSIDPPEHLEPTLTTPDPETPTGTRESEVRETAIPRRGSNQEVDGESPPRTLPALSRSRTGTLSWQQRPPSRDLVNRSPGSTSPTRLGHFRNPSTISTDSQPSRAQIAQSLGSKDPAWFRQTPDRGAGSPAYRQTEERSNSPAEWTASHRLPGMSREPTAEPDKMEEIDKSPSLPRTTSTIGESSVGNRYSSISSMSQSTGPPSPEPLADAPKLDHPPTDTTTNVTRKSAFDVPTKGLGGFVQSAMMRRSDSVSKRWSAQVHQGLSRSNSIVSNRNSVAAPSLTGSVSDMTPSTGLKFNQEVFSTTQRPGSSHSEATVQNPDESERPTTPSFPKSDTLRSEGSPSRAALYSHARSLSTATVDSANGDASSSPFTSRTMDPKRWSPTKASWLESALNRPESARNSRQSPSQPSWARERQSRGSVDMGRVSNFKEVTPVGLMRTPPPGTHFKKPSISGASSLLGSPTINPMKETVPDKPLSILENEASAKTEKQTEAPKSDVKPKTLEEGSDDEKENQSSLPAVETAEKPAEPKKSPEPIPEPEPVRKAPPALNAKPNFSLPSPGEPFSPKPKPESPVVDFRGNLRKREVAKDANRNEEPEFKNVFGRLKKTETRNYVAPDELKGNILRGKAALNVTGGPKKTERVDEFRDSLVKTKQAMKAGGGSIRRPTVGEKDEPPKPVDAVPEAIARRNTMTRPNSIRQPITNPQSASPTISTEVSSTRSSEDRSVVSPSVASTSPTKEELAVLSPVLDEPKASPVERQPAPWRIRNVRREPGSPVALDRQVSPTESASSARGLPSANRWKTTEQSPTATDPPAFSAKGKLAGRINPALAGILSRGPQAAAEGPKMDVPVPDARSPASTSPAAPLTHMTKGRARGPKRRLPKGNDAPTVTSAENSKEVGPISSPEAQSSQITPEPDVPSGTNSGESKDSKDIVVNTENAQTESPFAKQLSGVRATFQNALNSGLQQRLRSFSPLSPQEPSSPVSQPDHTSTRENEFPSDLSPRNRRPEPLKSNSISPSLSPVSSPTTRSFSWGQRARYMASLSSPLRSNFRDNGRDSPSTPPPKEIPGVRVADSSPPKTKESPPAPSKWAEYSLNKPGDPHRLSRKMSAPSLVAQAAEAREVIAAFFKTFPNQRDGMDIDPQLMLTNRLDESKIRTVNHQIWEITGDGKKQDLPANQEYVLYEGSMYLCVHIFEAQGTNSTEAYLWCGDDVSEGAIEDAHLFSRKVARENGCKLDVIRQGKEPVRFIQALGGILITRRGGGSRSSSSALYMLCGRKHMGQMAFDEVDYSLRNLCSGFPFVISAPFGKLYLWKGKGSGPEETGAARLISMDLGLTGEFEEVEEGQEPETFFEDFAGSNEANPLMTSDFWSLKPKYPHFRLRLFRIDHELGQPSRFWNHLRRPGSGSPTVRPNDTLQEIEPFRYKDLTEKDVYILDTFFEIYVIVGEYASQKSAEFATALVFAHEYGILAASLQDRPFIPKSLVALGGIPDRCQSVFRKWDQSSVHAPCLFPLGVAIEALRTQ